MRTRGNRYALFTPNNQHSPTAVTRIPAILHGSTFVSGFNDCVKYLNVTLDIDLDAELTAPQRALSMAVEALVSDSLYDALV